MSVAKLSPGVLSPLDELTVAVAVTLRTNETVAGKLNIFGLPFVAVNEHRTSVAMGLQPAGKFCRRAPGEKCTTITAGTLLAAMLF